MIWILFGSLTGIVGANSGNYLFNKTITGIPDYSVWAGGSFSNPTGLYTGLVNTLVTLNSYNVVYSSGEMSGRAIITDYVSGLNTSIFNLKTGDAFYNDFKSFFDNGWYSGDKYIKTDYGINGYNEFDIRLEMNKDKMPFYSLLEENDEVYIYGDLTVSNGLESITQRISGRAN